ncbi:MAG: ribose 5-phosphate isomerase B [Candidatus Saganbacteria bacterium]|nr:ribose 5-phosphate isomerase B [Candidatus Saganbacteria bacterium]
MKVAIGSDHAGFKLKQQVKEMLQKKGFQVRDYGTDSEVSVDYPDYVYPVADAVAKGEFERGVVICGSGVGACITANKVSGIRAVLAYDAYTAKQSREHGDCNVLCLAGRKLKPEQAGEIVDVWFKTGFSGEERHKRRIDKIERGGK